MNVKQDKEEKRWPSGLKRRLFKTPPSLESGGLALLFMHA